MSSTSGLSPFFFFLFFLFVLSFSPRSQSKPLSSPYLSPSTFFPNYPQMLQNLKIFIYPSSQIAPPTPSPLSLFHSSLLKSPFLTPHPHLAHLFYLPLPSNPSSRSIAQSIRDLRFSSPFWNRTLGADHFYLSCGGIGIESDRNLVELKKNSIQISCFPTIEGRFIPHKDISLPLISDRELSTESQPSKMGEFLGFFYGKEDREIAAVVDELRDDPEFLIESQPLDSGGLAERLERSRFCLFFYGFGRDLHIGQALKFGCVPVVISDRPILDLPFGDVLRWTEIAVFVGMRGGGKAVKHVLERTCGETYETMKELGKMASVHFMWNSSDRYDAFHTLMYQLWMRRHTVRYARRDWI
ncbi:probable glycosyltransferase At5g03795 [Magnolia sinica]|uniref:probable glycosyltransferase At5g03795 n=1 Tax=Magnolia sinica TaxID=86752 RepID=UPI0026583214|nr:probable glycosyltransferase At5g03795 [Magnolia sinica]